MSSQGVAMETDFQREWKLRRKHKDPSWVLPMGSSADSMRIEGAIQLYPDFNVYLVTMKDAFFRKYWQESQDQAIECGVLCFASCSK